MSHTVIGQCPRCGAPIYSPMMWHGITPPPAQYSCACFKSDSTVYTTNTSVSEELFPRTPEENSNLHKLVDLQEARIHQLEQALEYEKARNEAATVVVEEAPFYATEEARERVKQALEDYVSRQKRQMRMHF